VFKISNVDKYFVKGETMEKKGSGQFTYTRLHHVGVVVKDLDKAIAYLESMGIGPFKVGDKRKITVSFKGELHGKPAEWKTTVSNADLPDVQMELLEPAEGDQALKESLDKTGEGLHHIGFITDDLDKEIAKFKKAGVKIWTMSKDAKGSGFIYTDPSPVGGVAIEFRCFGKQ
jgi:methylmalonyl-CoA/ethylmalonyl-CoA epimerase